MLLQRMISLNLKFHQRNVQSFFPWYLFQKQSSQRFDVSNLHGTRQRPSDITSRLFGSLVFSKLRLKPWPKVNVFSVASALRSREATMKRWGQAIPKIIYVHTYISIITLFILAYIYIHIRMYIYTYTYIYIFIYVYIFMCIDDIVE